MGKTFRFDKNSTINEGRHRLFNPDKCVADSYFRRKSKTEGISYVMCNVSNKKRAKIQSIRFKKDKIRQQEAGKWIKKNLYRLKGTGEIL